MTAFSSRILFSSLLSFLPNLGGKQFNKITRMRKLLSVVVTPRRFGFTKFILWHRVKLLNHTRTIIHFMLQRLLVTIDFFRMKGAIITTRSAEFCGQSCSGCDTAEAETNNYRPEILHTKNNAKLQRQRE